MKIAVHFNHKSTCSIIKVHTCMVSAFCIILFVVSFSDKFKAKNVQFLRDIYYVDLSL